VLLFLNNHSSHLSCQALDLCKSNSVILLSFPPHCSHRPQPLDILGLQRICAAGA
jgi:hypothetical protein